MDANIVNLQTLFQQPISYRIPQFQRPYAWREDRQWKPLWEDVRKVAERYSNGEMDDKIRPHFMGAIVLFPQTSKTGEVTKSIVVDGQQRLTTLQLLIKATQQLFQSQDDMTRADRLRELTTNPESYCKNFADETKIRQSNGNDLRAFQAAIVDDDSNNSDQSIAAAYTYFKTEVGKWLNGDPGNRSARSEALEDTLTKRLLIAAIDLDAEEKPHIIFETLNARAERLKESDLIKNTVMYEADVIDDVQKARELWGMFDDEWWRKEADKKLERLHIDRFLNHWMVMRTQEEVALDEVARRFQDYIERTNRGGERVKIVAEEIRKAGKIYKNLETIEITEIQTFLERMKVMGLGVVSPLLLWLYTSDVSKEQRLRSVKALESCLVRQMLRGIGSQGLNKVFITILHVLENPDALKAMVKVDHAVVDTSDIIITCLHLFTKWPNDRELYECLVTDPMRGAVVRKKMVLEAIEIYLRDDKVEPLGDTNKLTVEHIMPEKWQQHWPLPSDKDEVEATNDRDEAIKSIGNLTLTTRKLNAKLSNSPWSEKRKTLGEHSSLFLNKTLLDGAPDIWNEAAIQERSEYLAKVITQIWPSADNFTAISA